MKYNYSKYKFNRLLTKDPSETSSLEYIITKNCTVSFFYYTNTWINTLQRSYENEGSTSINFII